jgi:hypothetical protein
MTLKLEEIKRRAMQPKPRNGSAAYMRWWRARTALGKTVKREVSQAQMMLNAKRRAGK